MFASLAQMFDGKQCEEFASMLPETERAASEAQKRKN